MDILFETILVLHIVAGTLGLSSGTVNIIKKKGGNVHRIVGDIFLYSMLTVSVSAFALSIIHPNYFLFIVGVFTLYLVGSGTRYLHLKQLGNKQKAHFIDWTLTYFMLAFGLAFVVLGIYHLVGKNIFGIVFIALGGVGLRMVKADFTNFRGKSKIKNVWLTAHIQRIMGAYTSAITAFIVVNNQILPGYIAWLLPGLILTPLIFKWTRKYQVKIAK